MMNDLRQIRGWFHITDEGYDSDHPPMASARGCLICEAEGNLNTLFNPRRGLKLLEALLEETGGLPCGCARQACRILAEIAAEVERLTAANRGPGPDDL